MADSPTLDPSALLAQQVWVERLARGLVHDSSLAADLAQETWLVTRGRGPETPAARNGFLAGVVRNLRRNAARGERRRALREERAACPEAWPSASELAERAELSRLLIECVLALDEHERTALLLRYFEDRSAGEIARRSGVPAGTVRARIARGLERLRARLEARMDRRELLGGLVLLGRGARSSAPPTRATAPTLPLIGGMLAMKGFVLAAGGAALLALAAGLFLVARDAEGRRAFELDATLAPATDTASSSTAGPTDLVVPEGSARREESVARVVPAPAAEGPGTRPRVRLLAQVTDENGTGLEGASVRCNEVQIGASTAGGHVALELPQDDRYEGLVVLEFAHPGFARELADVVLRASGDVRLGSIALRPAAQLRGRVFDERGNPVAGAELVATGLEDARTDPEELRRLGPLGDAHAVHGRSGADGRFELARVPLGAGRLWAGHGDSAWSALRFELGRAGLDGLELTLHPLDVADRITGRVLDPEGTPVGGARINTWFMAANIGASGVHEADEDGRFELRLQHRVAHDLTISDPENRWSELYLDAVEPGTLGLEFTFAPPRWIELEARSRADKALPETVLFTLDGTDGTRRRRMLQALEPLPESEPSVRRQRLRLPNAPFRVRVQALGFATAAQGPFDPLAPPARIAFELVQLPGVHGIVRTSTGQPAAGAKVGLYRLPGSNVEFRQDGFRLSIAGWSETTTTTDAEGRFKLYPPEPGDGRYEGRESVLRASLAGHAPTELAPRVYVPEEGLEVELELLRGGTLQGVARGGPGLDPTGYLLAFSRGDGDVKTLRLGNDGRYRLEALAPGPWEVRVLDEELAGNRSGSSSSVYDEVVPPFEGWSCTVRDGRTTVYDIDLTESAPARLSGTLSLRARSAKGWSATLTLGGDDDDVIVDSVELDDGGHFELDAPKAGAHVLVLSGPDDPNGRLVLREELALAPGPRTWALELSPGRVEGSGALGRGTRERFHRYEWQSGPAGRSLTAQVRIVPAADGHFELPTVPEGRGRILRNDPLAGQDDFAPWETVSEFELAPGGVAGVVLP